MDFIPLKLPKLPFSFYFSAQLLFFDHQTIFPYIFSHIIFTQCHYFYQNNLNIFVSESEVNPIISDDQFRISKQMKILQIHSLIFILVCFSSVLSDYTDLIYRGCADQKFPNPSQQYSLNLNTLFTSLISQSSKTNFSKQTTGNGGEAAIFGLYQCRGDLTAVDCNNCVSQFPKLSRKYCGEAALAARIQLVGCTMRYQVVNFPQMSSTELLYKVCKGGDVGTGGGFEGKRESGFEEVQNGVGSGGNGFYAASFGSIYVMGQCEGDLNGSDCGNCVKTAFERVKVECGNSMSGQVYLNQCYVSYSYYPNGVGDQKQASSSPGSRQNTAKTVAIVVGGTAAAFFVVAILLCLKSVLKKKPKKYQFGG